MLFHIHTDSSTAHNASQLELSEIFQMNSLFVEKCNFDQLETICHFDTNLPGFFGTQVPFIKQQQQQQALQLSIFQLVAQGLWHSPGPRFNVIFPCCGAWTRTQVSPCQMRALTLHYKVILNSSLCPVTIKVFYTQRNSFNRRD